MGVSTNGQICFGIAFEEDFEFPWSEKDGIDDWWIYDVLGFKHSKECYDEHGNDLPGITAAERAVYFQEKREFSKANPLPIELVNYCSGDCPMYILAVPATVLTNRRGYPVEFDPSSLGARYEDKQALLTFCAQHGITVPSEPKWLLTSYWG